MDDGSLNSAKPPSALIFTEGGDISVCTWNVNSVKARLPALSAYLQDKKPDVAMLQEIKTETDSFPSFELNGLGYYSLAQGQKSYNGVAVLSKHKIVLERDALPGAPDNGEQARYIEAYCPDLKSTFISVYVPNGEPPASAPESTERLEYKIAWLDALVSRAHALMDKGDPFIIGGDFNVIEYDSDVYNPKAFENTAFTVQPVRQLFKAFYYTGLTNALRCEKNKVPVYSYWDYRAGAWEKNNGILLDHLFLSPAWADKFKTAKVDAEVRSGEKASDHAPVRCDLSLQ
ncbi:MAG: exodeoxyribonuclease III [Alphaproteobacteria bacterium]|nr:exodeoxyribonuclease III [Alphaproteobacteria bacterium]